jgi:hypothetical protein
MNAQGDVLNRLTGPSLVSAAMELEGCEDGKRGMEKGLVVLHDPCKKMSIASSI